MSPYVALTEHIIDCIVLRNDSYGMKVGVDLFDEGAALGDGF